MLPPGKENIAYWRRRLLEFTISPSCLQEKPVCLSHLPAMQCGVARDSTCLPTLSPNLRAPRVASAHLVMLPHLAAGAPQPHGHPTSPTTEVCWVWGPPASLTRPRVHHGRPGARAKPLLRFPLKLAIHSLGPQHYYL